MENDKKKLAVLRFCIQELELLKSRLSGAVVEDHIRALKYAIFKLKHEADILEVWLDCGLDNDFLDCDLDYANFGEEDYKL